MSQNALSQNTFLACIEYLILTLPLIQTLSDASAADGFLKTQQQKKKLHKTCNFSFCHNVFHFQSQVIHSIIEIFHFLTKYVQSRLLHNCRMRERVNVIYGELADNKQFSFYFHNFLNSAAISCTEIFHVQPTYVLLQMYCVWERV